MVGHVALALETLQLSKHFANRIALDQVSIKLAPGSVHALLGENGAGKSTLAKCIAGVHQPESGAVLIDGLTQDISSPMRAGSLGIGMVHQHYTLAPNMSVAEHLVLAGGHATTVIDWRKERAELLDFLATTPFKLNLDDIPADLAAGEKQKLELLKQLYAKRRLLILDEPTSVLTPQEADEVLAYLRAVAKRGECTVLLITHKLCEVMSYADEVTVLRSGRTVHRAMMAAITPTQLAQAMVGEPVATAMATHRNAQAITTTSDAPVALQVKDLYAMGDRGTLAVRGVNLAVRRGEILGVAGVSGNGQRELVEVLVGQRQRTGGSVHVTGRSYRGTRFENGQLKLRALPEEPLRSACVASMSVAQNMALRDFDQAPLCRGWLRFGTWNQRARAWIAQYGISINGEDAPMTSLSGGNVQRVVLARELAGEVNVLIAANCTAGLDFIAVAEIHARILALRGRGTAILLISEDLDELLELSDRITVISGGRLVFETEARRSDRQLIGTYMAGSASS